MKRRIKRERFITKISKSPVTYILLVSLVSLFSVSAINIYKKSRIAQEKTMKIEEELRAMKQQEAGLRASLNDMNTSYGIEKSLREKFAIVKEGERAIIIVEDPSSSDNTEKTERKGFFGFLRKIF